MLGDYSGGTPVRDKKKPSSDLRYRSEFIFKKVPRDQALKIITLKPFETDFNKYSPSLSEKPVCMVNFDKQPQKSPSNA